MATNPFEKFRTKIAEGLFALNTKLFADGEKVSGDNPLPMKQYGSIVSKDADQKEESRSGSFSESETILQKNKFIHLDYVFIKTNELENIRLSVEHFNANGDLVARRSLVDNIAISNPTLSGVVDGYHPDIIADRIDEENDEYIFKLRKERDFPHGCRFMLTHNKEGESYNATIIIGYREV